MDWDNIVSNHAIFCECLVWMFFCFLGFFFGNLFNSESVFDDKKGLWNASYENFPEKYSDWGLISPRTRISQMRLIDNSLSYQNVKIQFNLYNINLIYWKFSLEDWFATKHYPQWILSIQYDVKRNGTSCMIAL